MDDELNKMFPQRPGARGSTDGVGGGVGNDDNSMSLEDEKIAKLTQAIRKDEKREFKAIVTDANLGIETMPQTPSQAGAVTSAMINGVDRRIDTRRESDAIKEVGDVGKVGEVEETKIQSEAKIVEPAETAGVIKSLRTYERDIAEAVRAGETTVSINLAAQKRREERHEIAPVATEKIARNTLYIIMSAILIVVATITLTLTFYFRNKNAGPPEVAVERKILSVDTRRAVALDSVSRTHVSAAIQNVLLEQGVDGTQGSAQNRTLTEIVLEKPSGAGRSSITLEEFFRAIAPNAPATLARSLSAVSNMRESGRDDQSPGWLLGMWNTTQSELFLIMRLDSFDIAYDGMLKWEKNMLTDLAPIFIRPDILVGSASNPQFEDLVVRSRDTRVLKNTRGDILLLYSFIDQDHVAITTSENTFREIVARYLASGLVR